MRPSAIEILRLDATHESALAMFFDCLQKRNVGNFFHPHELTADAARELSAYLGNDLYYVLVDCGEILGYGMLRGWDSGYEFPSLGIVIHPDAQGNGFGRLLMDFLRAAAFRRGARKIFLRVHSKNEWAVRLFHRQGYVIFPEQDGIYQSGFLNLDCTAAGKQRHVSRS